MHDNDTPNSDSFVEAHSSQILSINQFSDRRHMDYGRDQDEMAFSQDFVHLRMSVYVVYTD